MAIVTFLSSCRLIRRSDCFCKPELQNCEGDGNARNRAGAIRSRIALSVDGRVRKASVRSVSDSFHPTSTLLPRRLLTRRVSVRAYEEAGCAKAGWGEGSPAGPPNKNGSLASWKRTVASSSPSPAKPDKP